MADTFDPYYRWLSIPPSEQPPHHYRLLSVQLFEAELDVIESAADRQMTHLRSFQNGKHAQASQQLLNEISAARVELLDPQKKAAYDRQLRAQLAPKPQERPLTVAKALDDPAPSASPKSAVPTPPVPSPPVVRAAPRPVPRSGTPLPLIVGGIVALVVLVGLGWFVIQGMRSGGAKPLVADASSDSTATPPANTRPPLPAAGQTAASSPTIPGKGTPPSAGTLPSNVPNKLPPFDPRIGLRPGATVGEPDQPPPQPGDTSPTPPTPPVSDSPPPNDPAAVPQNPPIDTPDLANPEPAEPELPARLPVPEKALRDQKRGEIMKIFPPDKAGTVEAKAELAGQLLDTARNTPDDPAAQFALLNLAREQAVLAGEIELAFGAIDLLAANFAFDPDTVRVLSLEEAAKAGIPSDRKRPIVDLGREMVDRFVADNEFAKADALAERLLNIARPLRDTQLVKQLAEQRKAAGELAVAFAEVQESWQALEQAPKDPAANLAVGRYLAFARQDWNTALPHLAAGDNQLLAAAAQSELAKPASTEQVEQLAAAWWDAAEAETDRQAADLLRAHSGRWYRRIVGRLAGLEKVTAKQRIDQTADLPVTLPAGGETSGGPAVDVRSYNALRRATPAIMHIMNSVNEAAVCINGKPVAAAGGKASQFPCSVQLGDVITARLTPVAHSPSFAMVLQLASGHAIVPTNRQTWFLYSPADPARWWELPDNPPQTPVKPAAQHARPPQAAGTGCETIWGDYVYHIVEESDLLEQAQPITQRKRAAGSVLGVLSVQTRQNLSSIYVNDWYASYNDGIQQSVETPVLLAAGDVILVKGVTGAHGPSFAAVFRSADGKQAFVTKQAMWKKFKPSNEHHWWHKPELTGELPLLRKDVATGPLPAGGEELGCQAIWADYVYYIVQPEDLK